jgi:isoleucyl-tRNA synthetase
VPYNDLPKIDKYALFHLETVMTSMKDSYESYQFYKVYQVCLYFVCLCQFHKFDFLVLLFLSLNFAL